LPRTTLKDVATRAGVSYQTVSKVIRGQGQVAPATEERIWQAIDELDYKPNITARNLRLQSSNLLGYSWTSGSDLTWFPIQERFLHSLSHAAEARGYLITVFTHPDHDQYGKPTIYSDLYARRQVDGFILADTCMDDPRIQHLMDANIPFTAFGRANPGWDFCWVDVDGYYGIRLVMEHLLDKGHTRIGLVTWKREFLAGSERRRGYMDSLISAGLSHNQAYIYHGSDSSEAGEKGAEQLLALPPNERPTALVCASDQLAIGASHAATRAGYQVGKDIAITGYDNIPMMDYFTPPLTSVYQPIKEAGAHAIDLLLRQIQGDTIPKKGILLQPELVVRESTGFSINI